MWHDFLILTWKLKLLQNLISSFNTTSLPDLAISTMSRHVFNECVRFWVQSKENQFSPWLIFFIPDSQFATKQFKLKSWFILIFAPTISLNKNRSIFLNQNRSGS